MKSKDRKNRTWIKNFNFPSPNSKKETLDQDDISRPLKGKITSEEAQRRLDNAFLRPAFAMAGLAKAGTTASAVAVGRDVTGSFVVHYSYLGDSPINVIYRDKNAQLQSICLTNTPSQSRLDYSDRFCEDDKLYQETGLDPNRTLGDFGSASKHTPHSGTYYFPEGATPLVCYVTSDGVVIDKGAEKDEFNLDKILEGFAHLDNKDFFEDFVDAIERKAEKLKDSDDCSAQFISLFENENFEEKNYFYFVGVFDGHGPGGALAAQHAKNAFESSISETSDFVINSSTDLFRAMQFGKDVYQSAALEGILRDYISIESEINHPLLEKILENDLASNNKRKVEKLSFENVYKQTVEALRNAKGSVLEKPLSHYLKLKALQNTLSNYALEMNAHDYLSNHGKSLPENHPYKNELTFIPLAQTNGKLSKFSCRLLTRLLSKISKEIPEKGYVLNREQLECINAVQNIMRYFIADHFLETNADQLGVNGRPIVSPKVRKETAERASLICNKLDELQQELLVEDESISEFITSSKLSKLTQLFTAILNGTSPRNQKLKAANKRSDVVIIEWESLWNADGTFNTDFEQQFDKILEKKSEEKSSVFVISSGNTAQNEVDFIKRFADSNRAKSDDKYVIDDSELGNLLKKSKFKANNFEAFKSFANKLSLLVDDGGVHTSNTHFLTNTAMHLFTVKDAFELSDITIATKKVIFHSGQTNNIKSEAETAHVAIEAALKQRNKTVTIYGSSPSSYTLAKMLNDKTQNETSYSTEHYFKEKLLQSYQPFSPKREDLPNYRLIQKSYTQKDFQSQQHLVKLGLLDKNEFLIPQPHTERGGIKRYFAKKSNTYALNKNIANHDARDVINKARSLREPLWLNLDSDFNKMASYFLDMRNEKGTINATNLLKNLYEREYEEQHKNQVTSNKKEYAERKTRAVAASILAAHFLQFDNVKPIIHLLTGKNGSGRMKLKGNFLSTLDNSDEQNEETDFIASIYRETVTLLVANKEKPMSSFLNQAVGLLNKNSNYKDFIIGQGIELLMKIPQYRIEMTAEELLNETAKPCNYSVNQEQAESLYSLGFLSFVLLITQDAPEQFLSVLTTLEEKSIPVNWSRLIAETSLFRYSDCFSLAIEFAAEKKIPLNYSEILQTQLELHQHNKKLKNHTKSFLEAHRRVCEVAGNEQYPAMNSLLNVALSSPDDLYAVWKKVETIKKYGINITSDLLREACIPALKALNELEIKPSLSSCYLEIEALHCENPSKTRTEILMEATSASHEDENTAALDLVFSGGFDKIYQFLFEKEYTQLPDKCRKEVFEYFKGNQTVMLDFLQKGFLYSSDNEENTEFFHRLFKETAPADQNEAPPLPPRIKLPTYGSTDLKI
jgi:hypothetical protein